MLPPFNAKAVCPKCGYAEEAGVKWVQSPLPAPIPYPMECLRHEYVECDHLHRFCQRCGYSWAEACLDATPALAPTQLECGRGQWDAPSDPTMGCTYEED